MKKFIQIAGIMLLCGCGSPPCPPCSPDPILKSPLLVDGVELNDTAQTGQKGKYIVFLKNIQGSSPRFYTDDRFHSGENLAQFSQVEELISKETIPLRDSIGKLNVRIGELKMEKSKVEETLKEKNLLLKYLQGR